MHDWITQLQRLGHTDRAVIVTVARVRGSAPREVGAKMIITNETSIGTIGGGQLEHQCQHIATQLINAENGREMRNFPLGANCGQCCGGVVDIVFESISQQSQKWCERIVEAQDKGLDCILVTPLTNGPGTDKFVFTSADPVSSALEIHCQKLIYNSGAARFVKTKHHEDSACGYLLEPISASKLQIAVFGAGHVGTALVEVLAKLNCHVQWIDARVGQFGNTAYANVEQICAPDPSSHVAHLAAGSHCLVMTHSHALDFELCEKLLARDDIPFCGLIGSASKRSRFERLFRQAGYPEEFNERLTCPIGVVGINGKAPEEIAVSVAAQLLMLNNARPAQTDDSTHRRQQLAALYH